MLHACQHATPASRLPPLAARPLTRTAATRELQQQPVRLQELLAFKARLAEVALLQEDLVAGQPGQVAELYAMARAWAGGKLPQADEVRLRLQA